MRHIGTDLFDAIGKKWIVLIDRYSGYAWTHQLRRTDTATVTAQLSTWFTEYGWPSTLRSDGATVQDRILSFLQQQRHQARTLLPLQLRVQRTSRGSCEEYQNIDQSLPQARQEPPASHRSMEKHGKGRRCISESAVLRTKAETAATLNS